MRDKWIISFLLLALACNSLYAQQSVDPRQQVANEKLKESRIEAKGNAFRSMRPMLGIPKMFYNTASYSHNQKSEEPQSLPTNVICGMMYGEKITCEKGIWVSHNLDFGLPNWIACDIDPMATEQQRDVLAANMPAKLLNMNPAIWKSVISECWKWDWDKPVGGTTIVCGPLVKASELAEEGAVPVPYEYFLVLCKKTRGGLGYKSIGFLIPNRPEAEGGIYKFSQCVNLVEHKSGYDFFPKLPESIQENIEGMTTYELYCSYVEEAAYNDEPPERETDWMEALSDYLEDFNDR